MIHLSERSQKHQYGYSICLSSREGQYLLNENYIFVHNIYNTVDVTSGKFDTARLTKVTSIGSLIGWIGTIAIAIGLESITSLDYTVLGISLFWLVLTVGVVVYVKPGTPAALSQNIVWQYWLVASVVGIAVNIVAALLVTTGVASGEPIEETAPMQFGVILPWLAIYAGGYLLPAVYRRSSPALNSVERGIYGVAGLVTLVLTVLLAVMPELYGVMVLALAVLSLVPILTVRYRES